MNLCISPGVLVVGLFIIIKFMKSLLIKCMNIIAISKKKMMMKKIIYFINGKKRNIKVELCDTPFKKFRGLMFRKDSPPLLFVFNKYKKLSIHSFFCKPFKVIW